MQIHWRQRTFKAREEEMQGKQPQHKNRQGEGEGTKGCVFDRNVVDDILFIPEDRGGNLYDTKCGKEALSSGVALVFRRRQERKPIEGNKLTQNEIVSASEERKESEEDESSSSISDIDDETHLSAEERQLICGKRQRPHRNGSQDSEENEKEEDELLFSKRRKIRGTSSQEVKQPQVSKKTQRTKRTLLSNNDPVFDDYNYGFDFDGVNSSSLQSDNDKSARAANENGEKLQKSHDKPYREYRQSTMSPVSSRTASTTGKGRRRTSWIHGFVKQKSDGHRVCKHCGASFSPKTGSSSLKYHMENACPNNPRTKQEEFDKEKANTLLCRAIAEDCLSLRFADSPNLQAFVMYLKPGYKPPGRKTLTTKILPDVIATLEKTMHSKLNSIEYVSVSFDGWTSVACRNYIAILCHGITDSYVLETFLLKVVSVKASETAEYVAELTKTVLKNWGISLQNVVAIASDGAANMKCCVKKELKRPWIYCLAHAINRSVFKALDIEPIKTTVDKAKAICKLFKYPQAKRDLSEKQKALGLRAVNMKLCCHTRWGSTYKMLKRMAASREAIVACLAAQSQRGQRVQVLNEEEWDIIEQLISVLRHLNEASQQLSYQKVPTVGLIVPILSSLLMDLTERKCDKEDDDDVSSDGFQGTGRTHPAVRGFKEFLANDLGKRWNVAQENAPLELLMSAYLDPRTKDFSFVNNQEGGRQHCLQKARKAAERLLTEGQREALLHRQVQRTMESEINQKKNKEKGKEKAKENEEDQNIEQCKQKEKEARASHKRKAMTERMVRIYGAQATRSLRQHEEEEDYHVEVARYHALPACPLFQLSTDDPVMLNPLGWWREHQHEYPRLAALARRFLCITPTSVPCERAFSKAGWIVNKRRCALSDGNVSGLLFASFNKHHHDEPTPSLPYLTNTRMSA
jgi:zinc finger BED domain-containing protein 1 (E3 SUMO-protein ligase ZBED1)